MPQIMVLYDSSWLEAVTPSEVVSFKRPFMLKGKKIESSLDVTVPCIGIVAKRTLAKYGRIKRGQVVYDSQPYGKYNDRKELIEIQVTFGLNEEAGTNWTYAQYEKFAHRIHDAVVLFLHDQLTIPIIPARIGVWMLPFGKDVYIFDSAT